MRLKALAVTAPLVVLALAVATTAVAQPTPVDPWAGLYVGIGGHVGEAFGGNKLSFVDQSTAHDLSFAFTNQDKQLVGGVQLGQLWRFGGVYIGLEGDASFGAKDIKYITTVRGQLAVPAGPFLIYGTGGLAESITQEDFTVSSPNETVGFAGNEQKHGWVAGAGVQALLTPHLSFGVEGLYYGFASDTSRLNTALVPEAFDLTIDRNMTVVRVRLDYRFTSIF